MDKKAPTVDAMSLSPSEAPTLVQEDGLKRFTATGRPMPEKQYWSNSDDPYSHVQSLPYKFTDEDYISVPVPAEEEKPSEVRQVTGRRPTFFMKLKQALSDRDGGGSGKQKFRIVRMKRGDYLKYYARDEDGNYIGTEPEGSGPKY
ncbi:MAG: hypothetical protein M1817_002059 [Caeruleum heppii]|nr:MAG: hypothetical protein M1817_002059 [Caeruleum heppii]